MSDITISVGVDSKEAESGTQRVGRSLESLKSKSAAYRQESAATGQAVGRSFDSIRQKAAGANNEIDKVRGSFDRVSVAVKGFLGFAALRSLQQYSDTAKNLNSRLSLVTKSSEELRSVQKELLTLANNTRVSYASTVTLYARLARSLDTIGLSQKDFLRVTELTNKSLLAGGATTEEATSTVIQFSQALSKGKLNGDEFNSVLENAPVLTRAIADGLGVTIGKLYEMRQAGTLTADAVVKALLSQGNTVDALAAKIQITLGGAWTVAQNNITSAIGSFDEATGASSILAQAIITVSENITILGKALVLAGGLYATKFATGIIASSRAFIAARAGAVALAEANVATAGTELQLAEAANVASLGLSAQAAASLNAARANAELAAANLAAARASTVTATATAKLSSGMAVLGGPAGIAVLAAGALYLYRDEIAESARQGNLFARGLAEIIRWIKELGKVIADYLPSFDDFELSISGFLESTHLLEEGTTDVLKTIIAQRNAMSAAAVAADELSGNGSGGKGGLAGVTAEADKLADALDKMQDDLQFQSASTNLNAVDKAVQDFRKNIKDLTREYRPLTAAEKERVEIMEEQVRYNTAADEFKQIIEDTRTPAEKLNKELADLEALRPFAQSTDDATALDRKITALREGVDKSAQIFKDFATDISNAFTGFFENILEKGVKSFKDLGTNIFDLFKKMLARMATLAIAQPVIIPLVTGIGSALGLSQSSLDAVTGQLGGTGGASSLSNLSNLFSLSKLFGQGGSLTTSLLSPGSFIGSNLDKLGASLGFGPSLAGGPVGNFVGPTLPGTAPGSLSGGFSPLNIGAGLAGGFLGQKVFGNGGLPQTVLSGVGGYAGGLAGSAALTTALGSAAGPVGALAGAFIGSAIGSLFGKKPSDKTAAGSTNLGSQSVFDLGSLSGKKYSAENNQFRDFALQYANSLAAQITKESGVIIDKQLTVQIGNRDGLRARFGQGSFTKYNDPNAFFTGITKEIAKIANESGGATQSINDLSTAIEHIDFKDTTKALEDIQFTLGYSKLGVAAETITQTALAIEQIHTEADKLRETATRLGLALDRVNFYENVRIDLLRKQIEQSAARKYVETVSSPLLAIADEITSFANDLKEAQAIGANTTFLQLAHNEKLKQLQADLITQEDARVSALQEQSDTASELIDKYKQISESLINAAAQLKTGSLSNLSVEEKLREATRQFDEAVQNKDADKLEGLGNTLLTLGQQYYGAGVGYSAIFDKVQSGLTGVAAYAQEQVSVQTQILASSTDQIRVITAGNLRITQVLEQIAKQGGDLPTALANILKATGGISGAVNAGIGDAGTVPTASGTRIFTDAIQQNLAAIDKAGKTGLIDTIANTVIPGVVAGNGNRRAAYAANSAANDLAFKLARQYGLPGFQYGGITPVNKPFIVGESGPEIMSLNKPYNVTPIAANDNGGDMRLLLQEVRTLNQNIALSNSVTGRSAANMEKVVSRLNGQIDKLVGQK